MASYFTPGEQALIDQAQALLRDHVQAVRGHWASGACDFGGGDNAACIGMVTEEAVDALSEHNAKTMYMEALIALVEAGVFEDGEQDGGAAPGD